MAIMKPKNTGQDEKKNKLYVFFHDSGEERFGYFSNREFLPKGAEGKINSN